MIPFESFACLPISDRHPDPVPAPLSNAAAVGSQHRYFASALPSALQATSNPDFSPLPGPGFGYREPLYSQFPPPPPVPTYRPVNTLGNSAFTPSALSHPGNYGNYGNSGNYGLTLFSSTPLPLPGSAPSSYTLPAQPKPPTAGPASSQSALIVQFYQLLAEFPSMAVPEKVAALLAEKAVNPSYIVLQEHSICSFLQAEHPDLLLRPELQAAMQTSKAGKGRPRPRARPSSKRKT
jgi:hypothetical protein